MKIRKTIKMLAASSILTLSFTHTSSATTVAQYNDVSSVSNIQHTEVHKSSDGEFIDDFLFDFAPGVTSATVSGKIFQGVGFGRGLLHFDHLQVSLYDTTTNMKIAATTNLINSPLVFTIDQSIINHNFKLNVEGLVEGESAGRYRVSISAVPVPAAAWLFLSGLFGVVGFKLFRRKAPQ